jgi:hypothetical protein
MFPTVGPNTDACSANPQGKCCLHAPAVPALPVLHTTSTGQALLCAGHVLCALGHAVLLMELQVIECLTCFCCPAYLALDCCPPCGSAVACMACAVCAGLQTVTVMHCYCWNTQLQKWVDA